MPVPDGADGLGTTAKARELVYTGVVRTPLASLWPVCLDGVEFWPAAELFATTRDVYLVTGELPADPSDADTADGRPATVDAARGRLARMALCDRDGSDRRPNRGACRKRFAAAQTQLVRHAIEVQSGLTGRAFDRVLFTGQGRFLGPDLIGDGVSRVEGLERAEPLDLADLLSPALSAALPAYAVARLCEERR